MGRPPSNGAPAFRFNAAEVMEMETILQDHENTMPPREVLVAIADKFSNSPERLGKFVVQTKQIWNWFQNKRYAIRARTYKTPSKLAVSSMQSMSTVAPQHLVPVVSTMPAMQETSMPVVPSPPTVPVVSKEDNLSSLSLPQSVTASPGKVTTDNVHMEFEARSAKDGAWYDVTSFLSLKNLEAGDPEVLVRFAGFGPEEDEWINVRKHVRHRSLPCEPSECVAILPGDLILCFQEGKEQALYYDAHVLDAQRRRHDVRGCRCRFLVRYDHDQSEEIVPLRKICRRPETDYRLQQLHALNDSSAEQRKSTLSTQHKAVSSAEQIKPSVDSSISKEGISNSTSASAQMPPATDLHVNPSVTEELKEDKHAAPSAQHAHLEVINLDPETEVQKNSIDVKDPADEMDVDDRSEKPEIDAEKRDFMLMCGIDATKRTSLVNKETGDIPASAVDGPTTQDVPITDDKEHVATETYITPDKGKTNVPADAGIYTSPLMSSTVNNITLEPEIAGKNGSTDTEKTDAGQGIAEDNIGHPGDSGPDQ